MVEPRPTDASAWRTRAQRFAEGAVAPLAAQIDRDDRVPDALVARLAQEGFLGLGIPPDWDGSAGDTRSISAVLEEISRASSAVAVLVAVHLSVCAAPLLQWGTDTQKERYLRPLARGAKVGAFALTEPGAGSDSARITTRYAAQDGVYRLDGTKMFTSSGVSAGLILAFATRDPGLGHSGISAFLVPTDAPGFSVASRFDKLGLRGSETTELVLRELRLPSDHLLGSEGAGLRIALGALTGGRIGIASCALGVAQAAFEELVRSVRADDAPWKRTILAQSFADLSAARTLVEHAAARKDSGLPFVTEASVAKLVASRAAVSIASAGVDVAGVEASRSGGTAERLWRDARVFPIVEGTTEIQELILARELLGTADGANL
jgi:butyryl-CoA dehydrogenase